MATQTRARSRRLRCRLVLAGTGVVAVALAGLAMDGSNGELPAEHQITVNARSYAFDPPIIRVQRGDTLRLRFASSDVVHGFYLEGHDLDVTIPALSREVEVERGGQTETVEEVVLVADRAGKFRYRCSKTCGAMHPFMVGELVVGPNLLFRSSAIAAIALLLGALGLVWPDPSEAGES